MKRFAPIDLILLVVSVAAFSLPDLPNEYIPTWTYTWVPKPEGSGLSARAVSTSLVVTATFAIIWWLLRKRTFAWVCILSLGWLFSSLASAYFDFVGPNILLHDEEHSFGASLWAHFAFRLHVLFWFVLIGLVAAAFIHNLRPTNRDSEHGPT